MAKRILISLLLFLSLSGLSALPVIDSIVSTTSSCRDNGLITVYAHSTSALRYAITAGPQLRAQQISRTLSALPPGTYTVQVSDASGTTVRQASVAGSYQYFDFSPYVVYPRCATDTGTILIGHVDSSVGSPPFSWQLIEPGGIQRPIQPHDTFPIYYSGAYQIRCIDACGTVRVRGYDVYSYSNSYLRFIYFDAPMFVHCDSLILQGQVSIGGSIDNLSFPLSFMDYDSRGDTVRLNIPAFVSDTILPLGNGRFIINHYNIVFTNRFGHVRAGEQVSFELRDGCGSLIQSSATAPYNSLTMGDWNKIPVPGQCGTGTAYLPQFSYSLPRPSRWVLIDDVHNTIVDSSTSGMGISLHPSGSDYTFMCFDECGDTLRQQFYWVASIPPQPAEVYIDIQQSSCLDSTASLVLSPANFSGPTVVKILSGPTAVHSSKPGFSYQAHITYPYVINSSSPTYLNLSGLPAGHYVYEVSDSCGHFVTGVFDISAQQLTSFMHRLTSGRHCAGGGSIQFSYSAGHPTDNISVGYSIRNITTGQLMDSNATYGSNGSATLNNIAPGTYVVRLDINTYNISITDHSFCPIVYDTITIPDYTFPDMPLVSYSPGCFGEATITAQMDTTLGVPSYIYQIIDGPMTSPVQADNGSFQVSQIGVYTILGIDACGNGLIRHISVDSLYRAIPVIRSFKDTCFHTYVRGVLYTESTVACDTLRTSIGCDSLIHIDSVVIRGIHDRRPLIALPADTFCAGAGGDVSAIAGYHLYQWDNGDTTRIIHVSDSGWYRLIVTDTEQCTLSDQIHIALLDSPSVTAGWIYADSVCLDDPLQVQLTLSGPNIHYAWSDIPDAILQRQFTDSGIYIFTVRNECAAKSYTLYTTEKNCDEHAYPPNAFSPNGDGINDIYRIYSSYDFKSFSLLIFDRWGEKVFESSNEANGWDGRYRNEDLPTGVYVYEYIGVWPTGHSHTSRGSITLIR